MRPTFSLTVLLFLLVLAGCSGDTDPATDVTSGSATLHADVACAAGETGTYFFRYTKSPTLPASDWPGKTATDTYDCAQAQSRVYQAAVTGLDASSTYYFAVCGTTSQDTRVPPGEFCLDSAGRAYPGSSENPVWDSFTTQAPPPPPDSDGDGFPDSSDLCPNTAGVAPDGCPAPVPAGTQGLVRPFRELRSDMDTYVLNAVNGNTANRTWLQHFDRLRVWMNGSSYPADKAIAQTPRWMPTSWKYADAQVATYRGSATIADEHYLWDGPLSRPTCSTLQAPSSTCRQRLYVNFSCDGLTAGCDQYAADLGNPNTRARYVDGVKVSAAKAGGLWMDDVNFYLPRVVSNGAGTFVRPWDPRTNAQMTDDAWAGYMLQLVKDSKAALPDPLEVVMNTVAYHGPGILNIPSAKAALSVADGWEIEGNTVGQDVLPYKTQSDYAHSVGAFVVHDIQASPNGRVYPEAVYLCLNGGNDFYGHVDMKPTNSWDPLWDKDLGAATSACTQGTDGIYRRSFERGNITVNPSTKTGTIG